MFKRNKYNDNPPNIHQWKKRRLIMFSAIFGILAFVILNVVFYLLTNY